MKNSLFNNLRMIAVIIAATSVCVRCYADNPIIQTKYSADPDPVVYNDTVYLFTSHDENDAQGWNFKMKNWMLYTSTDMVNWTDHGIVAGTEEPYNTFPWVDHNYTAWAPKCIVRNGKWYLYVCFQYKGHFCLGVAVADHPFGPYVDVLGKPLVFNPNSIDDIDPAPIIDADGQAYLYWGHVRCFYVKLNQDMISCSGDIVEIPRPFLFEEGPEMWMHNGKFYMGFASYCCPEGIGYAMSDSPTGPWTSKGHIMDSSSNSSGNSCGYMDYKGSSYVFGFNYALLQQTTQVHHERRSVCVTKINYNDDGTITKAPWWRKEGVSQIVSLNPYVRTEAETICWSSGVRTEPCNAGGMDVSVIDSGDYIMVKGVDFGDAGAATFSSSVASISDGSTIELHLDSLSGKTIGTVSVPNTGGWQNWKSVATTVSGATGNHDFYLVLKGNNTGHLFNFDYWRFGKKSASERSTILRR